MTFKALNPYDMTSMCLILKKIARPVPSFPLVKEGADGKKIRFNINLYIEIKDNTDFLIDIIFIAEKSGKILKTAYRKCKCYSSFFNYVYSLIKEEK